MDLTGGDARWTSVLGGEVTDARLISTGQDDAFDRALHITINGTEYEGATGELTTSLNGQVLLTGPQSISGLNVAKEYYAHATSNTLRTLLSLTNPTSAEIGVLVYLQTNVGSDGSTQTITTSSGDAHFTTDDRYLITDDYSTTSQDPTNTHVLFGPGAPVVGASAVGTMVFQDSGQEGVGALYHFSVPAGQRRSLAFFNQIHPTAANAQAGAVVFDWPDALRHSGLLAGLSAQQISETVNLDVDTSSQAPYYFRKIIDSTGDDYTDGVPSINDEGAIAYERESRAIVTVRGGSATTIDDYTGPRDEFHRPAINAGGAVSYYATTDSGGSGIFSKVGGAVVRIADSAGDFSNSFGTRPDINAAGTVAFRAGHDIGGQSILKGNGGDPIAIVTANAGETFTAVGEFPSINDAGVVAFTATFYEGGTGDEVAVFAGSGGEAAPIADTVGEFSFIHDDPDINNSGNVVFGASLDAGGEGIFMGNSGPTTEIAHSRAGYADFGSPAVNDAGMVAFKADLVGGGNGIFTGGDPVADKVIQTGDILFGDTVVGLSFFRGLNNNGEIAFTYLLASGRVGVAVATPVTPGDYDRDGDVDGVDLVVWKYGAGGRGPALSADGDLDGDVDGADFLSWQRSLGTGVDQAVVARPVPEPSPWWLLASGAVAALCRKSSRELRSASLLRTVFRRVIGSACLILALSLGTTHCQAGTLVETALLGPSTPLSEGNYVVSEDQFLGVRFEVASPAVTTAIGGHFANDGAFGNNLFFAAVVALTDGNDSPDSTDLSTPDVLGTALLAFPNPSADVLAPLSLSLSAGHYALMFGSGLFGATGYGGAKTNNDLRGDPSWFHHDRPTSAWYSSDLDGVRFVVTAVPEPSVTVLYGVGAVGAWFVLKRTRVFAGRAIMAGLFGIGLSAVAAREAGANFAGGDAFTTVAPVWSTDSAGGAAQFLLDVGKLHFVADAPPTVNDTVQRAWNQNLGDYTADWSLQVDVAIDDFPMTENQYAALSLSVENVADVPNDFVRITLRRDDAAQRHVYADAVSNGQFTPTPIFVPTSFAVATLGLSYDSATRTITAGYAIDRPIHGDLFYPILAVPIESGGSDWDMNSADGFRAWLVGQTQYLDVTFGQMAIDNFVATGQQLVFVPEPPSAVLFASALASMAQAMRRRVRP